MAELAIIKNTAELERLEGVITRNLQSFYEVGRALAEIRDRGYYRDVLGFETFEGYCKAKWDFAGNYARRLIASAETVDNIKNVPIGTTPATESQCRPLARLEPDQQREAWQQAVDTAPEGKVTAAIVAKVVKEMTAPTTKEEAKEFKIEPKGKEVTEAKGIATFAISHLGRIRRDDPRRYEQLTRVMEWIIKNRGEEAQCKK
jgi:hypothetical protein